MRLLLEYTWPGNVRELANVMEYAVAVAKIETILPEDLPEEIRCSTPAPRPLAAEPSAEALPESHQNGKSPVEAARLVAALEAHHWSRSHAARALGLSRSTLWRKMRELRLTEDSQG